MGNQKKKSRRTQRLGWEQATSKNKFKRGLKSSNAKSDDQSSNPKTYGQLVEFTPLFAEIVRNYDLLTAAVYGRIWRYCQGEDKRCWASLGKIASELRISDRTVKRRVDRLVEAGELIRIYSAGETADLFISREDWDHRHGFRGPPDRASSKDRRLRDNRTPLTNESSLGGEEP